MRLSMKCKKIVALFVTLTMVVSLFGGFMPALELASAVAPFSEAELTVVAPLEPSSDRQDLVFEVPVSLIPEEAVTMSVTINWDSQVEVVWPDAQTPETSMAERIQFLALDDQYLIFDLDWNYTSGWGSEGCCCHWNNWSPESSHLGVYVSGQGYFGWENLAPETWTCTWFGPMTGMMPQFTVGLSGATSGFEPALRTNHAPDSGVQATGDGCPFFRQADIGLASANPTGIILWLIDGVDWDFENEPDAEQQELAEGFTTVPDSGVLTVTIPSVLLHQGLYDENVTVSVAFAGPGSYAPTPDGRWGLVPDPLPELATFSAYIFGNGSNNGNDNGCDCVCECVVLCVNHPNCGPECDDCVLCECIEGFCPCDCDCEVIPDEPTLTSLTVADLQLTEAQSVGVTAESVLAILYARDIVATIVNTTTSAITVDDLVIVWTPPVTFNAAPDASNVFSWAVTLPNGLEVADGVQLTGSITVTNYDIQIIDEPTLTALTVGPTVVVLTEAQTAATTTSAAAIAILEEVVSMTYYIAHNEEPSLGDGLVITWSLVGGVFKTSPGAVNEFEWTVTLPGGLEVANNVQLSGIVSMANFDAEQSVLLSVTLTESALTLDAAVEVYADVIEILDASGLGMFEIVVDNPPADYLDDFVVTWTFEGAFDADAGATNTFIWTITPPSWLVVLDPAMLTGTLEVVNHTPGTGGIRVGDIYENHRIEPRDVLMLRAYVMQMHHTLPPIALERIALGAGSVYGAATIQPRDVLMLRAYVMGMRHTLPEHVIERLEWFPIGN